MHTRKEILKNQKEFGYEIKKWLLNDFNNSKNDLLEIETYDEEIQKEINKLSSKFKKTNPEKDIKKFFINENNIYPKYYAWWDEITEKVEIYLYESKQKEH
jgi:hypothetical protein